MKPQLNSWGTERRMGDLYFGVERNLDHLNLGSFLCSICKLRAGIKSWMSYLEADYPQKGYPIPFCYFPNETSGPRSDGEESI